MRYNFPGIPDSNSAVCSVPRSVLPAELPDVPGLHVAPLLPHLLLHRILVSALSLGLREWNASENK